MSGDNLHGKQPDIRYSVDVRHHEEWEAMSLSERMKVMTKALDNWEIEYLKENKVPGEDYEKWIFRIKVVEHGIQMDEVA